MQQILILDAFKKFDNNMSFFPTPLLVVPMIPGPVMNLQIPGPVMNLGPVRPSNSYDAACFLFLLQIFLYIPLSGLQHDTMVLWYSSDSFLIIFWSIFKDFFEFI